MGCIRFWQCALLVAFLAIVPARGQQPALRLTRIATGLAQPVDIANAGDGSNRLFVVEKMGRVRIIRNGAVLPTPFLDIRSRVRSSGSEQGLLGIAFPPDFSSKQYFYVNYIDLTSGSGNTIVARYRVSGNPDVADPASETVILRIRQPFENHNGGQILFSPRDGYLYVGMGDGGSGGDPQDNGQRKSELLGKLLRIDVESGVDPYGVPPDNPFANEAGARGEIWALGLRNPWRFAFDRQTGDLYIADVGQNLFEEVSFQAAASPGGENYGWKRMEGMSCFSPPSNCDRTGLTLPVLDYGRSLGVSVTGGKVYRGTRFPALLGMYFYADYGSGNLWGLRRENDTWVNRLLVPTRMQVSTFGEDEEGEVYLANLSPGEIHQLVGDANPAISSGGVVNAASYAPGLAPGSIFTVFGAGFTAGPGITSASRVPLPTDLAGTSVTINGMLAPLFASANVNGLEQVNFQAPFELGGATNANVVVARNGLASVAVSVGVQNALPGLFLLDGRAAIAVRDRDKAIISRERPARRNDVLTLYATGLGLVDNPPPTGAAAPSDGVVRTLVQPLVTIGGASAEVTFAGLAPTYVGLYQINIRVNAGTPAGEQDIVVTVGGASSRPAKIMIE